MTDIFCSVCVHILDARFWSEANTYIFHSSHQHADLRETSHPAWTLSRCVFGHRGWSFIQIGRHSMKGQMDRTVAILIWWPEDNTYLPWGRTWAFFLCFSRISSFLVWRRHHVVNILTVVSIRKHAKDNVTMVSFPYYLATLWIHIGKKNTYGKENPKTTQFL